jgi:polyferredoxin
MKESNGFRVVIQFLLLVFLVIAFSLLSTRIWRDRPETTPERRSLIVEESMSLVEFSVKNNLSSDIIREVFRIRDKADLQKRIGELNITREEISVRIDRALALRAEGGSKNWIKILVKFILWFVFLVVVLSLIGKRRITPKLRRVLYLIAIVVFGVVLGSDPSPMGTVKDAIALYGTHGVMFPPRLIAMTVFLIMVFVANKFICSWGCQLGTLQDLIFRFNRTAKDRSGIFKQYKLPFLATNGIRIVFFVLFTSVAFLWSFDIVGYIDPFKVYKPAVAGIAGGIFIGALLLTSLFIYRPWCNLFCPFGLIGWLVEKISLFKIVVNYDTCIACETCAKACPSTVMGAILKRERVIPDCFACGTCIDVCPTDSIGFTLQRRVKPPADKFTKK